MDLAIPGLAACTNLAAPSIPGAEVLWITSNALANVSFSSTIATVAVDIPPVTYCNVSLALTHPGDDDIVHVTVLLPPAESWNGRYQASGGGGLAAGYAINMIPGFLSGFATSFTDGGLTLNHTIDPQTGLWGLKPDGTLNEPLLLNMAWRSIHDMSVAAKDVIQQVYAAPANYSYWNGCSQGGRQGYAAGAKYPDDFDGFLAISPGLNAEYVALGDYWPALVMENEGEVLPSCVLDAFQAAILNHCDGMDGVEDGMLSDFDLLLQCTFNTTTLVGSTIACQATETETETETPITITERQATIVSKILDGPRDKDGKRLWWGVAPGASFAGISQTILNNGTWTPQPFTASTGWLRNMIMRNSTYSLNSMSYATYLDAFETSISSPTGKLYSADSFDLSSFKSRGGKLLTWVGLADEYIHPSNLLQYRETVESQFGGGDVVDEFYRIFTAPGVGHCNIRPSVGPQPVDAMGALVDWVENGNAPEALPARTTKSNGKGVRRDLCRYPKKSVYRHGDVHEAASFICESKGVESQESGSSCVQDVWSLWWTIYLGWGGFFIIIFPFWRSYVETT